MDNRFCQRCGQGPDPDLRTLWMACFYAMDELGLPFERFAINGIAQRWVRSEPVEGFFGRGPHPHPKQVFEDVPNMKPHRYDFFRLRVCKDCRADWMNAIKAWFHTPKIRPVEDANIPIREDGTTRMITRAEWERRQHTE